ncbi:MAG: hypothetical protein ACK56I_36805, partial [bacterium]
MRIGIISRSIRGKTPHEKIVFLGQSGLPSARRRGQSLIPMNFFDVLVSSIQDPQAATQKSDLQGLLGALTGASGQGTANQMPSGAAEGLAG